MTAWPCGRGMTSRRKPCCSDSCQPLCRSLLGVGVELRDPTGLPENLLLHLALILSVSGAGGVPVGGGARPGPPEECPAGMVSCVARMLPPRSLGPGATLTHSFLSQLGIRAVLRPAILGDGPEHSGSPAPHPPEHLVCPHLCWAVGHRPSGRWVKGLSSGRP